MPFQLVPPNRRDLNRLVDFFKGLRDEKLERHEAEGATRPTRPMSARSQAALLGGAFIGVCSALPFISVGNCCCLWIVGGGFLAAYLLQQDQAMAVTIGDGAAVGFLAGIVGAFVHLIVSLPLELVMVPLQSRLFERMMQDARDLSPAMQAFLRNMSRGRMSPAARVAFQFLPMLLVGAIFAPIGGMLGALFVRRGLPPAVGTAGGPPGPA